MNQLDKAIAAELNDWEAQDKVQRLWASDASLWTNNDEAKWTGWLGVIAAEFAEVSRIYPSPLKFWDRCRPHSPSSHRLDYAAVSHEVDAYPAPSNLMGIETLASEIKAAGFADIVLLGMGGSSLCPAMMASIFGEIDGYPRLYVLDSTDPLQIRHLENKIDLERTFFIVSSKSGSTLESNILKQYFYARLQSVLKKQEVGDHFLAITDPDTTLAAVAKNEHFKAVFYGMPSIGGRYSALSNFGMVPSGLMGIDVKEFLHHAEKMAQACSSSISVSPEDAVFASLGENKTRGILRGGNVLSFPPLNSTDYTARPQDTPRDSLRDNTLTKTSILKGERYIPKNNPSVLLGITLGVCAKQGKDKVTLVISPGIRAFGAWLEQLLAESTGKVGKGLIPVDQESLGPPDVYGNDRLFVYICLDNAADTEQDHAMQLVEQSGHIVVRLHVADKKHLGAELFRWEIATAVASSVIGVNPFDQPDVEASKVRALQLTDAYEQTGKLPQPSPIFSADGMQLFADEVNAHEITQQMLHEASLAAYLRAHFSRVQPGDYVALSAFIEMSDEHTALLQKSRTLIRDAKKVATCLGFGPRFLHSTGQAHKGGPNTGVFLQITADHDADVQVPGRSYTFGSVINAQAQADFEVLAKRSRRILRIHIGNNICAGLEKLYELLRGI